MGRTRFLAVLVIALVAGAAFAFGTHRYLKNVPVKTVSMATQPVVVAAADLDLGTELRVEDVKVVQWPAASLPPGAFGDTKAVVGRGLVMPMIENEPVLPMKLAPSEAGVGLPPIIPTGKRAVSVRVNEVIGVAGYVLPGTRVDVLATVSPSKDPQNMTTKIVLSNVQVLAAGTKLEQDSEKGKPMPVTVVTMLVDPVESERLTLAATEGKIQLALRNPLDKDVPVTPGIRPAVLMGSMVPAPPTARRPVIAKASMPVMMADPFPTVEIIRGDKRAHEVVR